MFETTNRITEVMAEKGVGVRELSRRAGLSLSCVRRLRKGGLSGSVYTWKAVADALGVPVDELIGGEDERGE